eukprot:1144044-Pelagomonas_calceolata.AAC.7
MAPQVKQSFTRSRDQNKGNAPEFLSTLNTSTNRCMPPTRTRGAAACWLLGACTFPTLTNEMATCQLNLGISWCHAL